mgnify:CR=1 FL=1
MVYEGHAINPALIRVPENNIKSLPGFEFHQGQSVNPDEEEFARRMKRKRRRGRKL